MKTDNNPLTYVMSLLNLDATGHWWVAALANFHISVEYQWGSDNKVTDCLSRVLNVKELMQRAKAGREACRAEANDPCMIQEDEIGQRCHTTVVTWSSYYVADLKWT